MIFTLAAMVVATAPPPLFKTAKGPELGAMVAKGVRVVSQLSLDLTGTVEPERAVLLGRPGPDGVVGVVGVAVVSQGTEIQVLDSVLLPTHPGYSVTFDPEPLDLDGDGKLEIPLATSAGEADVGRFEDTLYYSVRSGRLVLVYTLARRVERPPFRETRTLSVVRPGQIQESIRTKSGSNERHLTVVLAFEPELGRFVLVNQ